MRTRTPRDAGLSPTLRQLMILVLCVGTLLAAYIGSMRNGLLGGTPEQLCASIAFFIACWPVPWMMILLFLFDRRGPLRNWYIARCFASWGLVAVPTLLLADPVCWFLCGRLTMGFPLLPLTALVCLVGLPRSLQSVQPGLCIHCGRKSIIGVDTRFVPFRISQDTGWCASCGALYERENVGTWNAVPSDGDEAT